MSVIPGPIFDTSSQIKLLTCFRGQITTFYQVQLRSRNAIQRTVAIRSEALRFKFAISSTPTTSVLDHVITLHFADAMILEM